MNNTDQIEVLPQHVVELQNAVQILETSSIATKITNIIGKPIEMGLDMLPESWSTKIGKATQTALLKATDAAIYTIKDVGNKKSSNKWHKLGVAVSGGLGGFFGLPALIVELPISTTIMLRSIVDIARAEGESVNDIETKLACLEVFALGGKTKLDDSSESGYYLIRGALSKSVTEATKFLVEKGATEKAAPVLIRFITTIAERFSIQVGEKAMAQAIPAIGAAGGALINTVFIDHFQDMAKGHFVVRKLERLYGKEEIKKRYEEALNAKIALSN